MNNPADIDRLIEMAQAYYDQNRYEKAIEYFEQVLKVAPENVKALSLVSYAYDYLGKTEEAIEYCERWIAASIQSPSFPLAHLAKLYEKKAERETQAKLDERNKIIAEISHSIKNIISSVIDLLEVLKEDADEDRPIIENALKGANRVREIVNAQNLSSAGTIDDFYYDARHNSGKDASDIKTLIVESLKYSVGNMFDSKYFSNFMRKYFPTKEIYIQAKKEWERVSQINNLDRLGQFLRTYCIEDADIAVTKAEGFVIGNEKGSAIKLLMLFQEIIQNAVKYSASIDKSQRYLEISFSGDKQQLSFRVENRFQPNAETKTSGLGQGIIENFAKRLNTVPIIDKTGGVCSVEITFENFWEKEHL